METLPGIFTESIRAYGPRDFLAVKKDIGDGVKKALAPAGLKDLLKAPGAAPLKVQQLAKLFNIVRTKPS